MRPESISKTIVRNADAAPVPAQATPSGRQVRIETGALFAGRREAIIVLRGEEYRLRITRQDKLILTK